jgi:hypothetical protein
VVWALEDREDEAYTLGMMTSGLGFSSNTWWALPKPRVAKPLSNFYPTHYKTKRTNTKTICVWKGTHRLLYTIKICGKKRKMGVMGCSGKMEGDGWFCGGGGGGGGAAAAWWSPKTKGCNFQNFYPTPCKTKRTNTKTIHVWKGTHGLLYTIKNWGGGGGGGGNGGNGL